MRVGSDSSELVGFRRFWWGFDGVQFLGFLQGGWIDGGLRLEGREGLVKVIWEVFGFRFFY